MLEAEPFFVKNLETIQGDERDVIFMSVGYGRDDSGYMAMNFGPLSGQGGERRLNVLISRAKERMEVFSSINADDIDLERVQTIGPRVLKRFLRYAQSGRMDVAEIAVRAPDPEFEEEVGRALSAIGHQVVHQVGTAGFLVDLAIRDPERPGRYLLGIECDGATYHSSRSARDRDRLRQAVLEDRGWHIHRIWSTDWFKDPDGELRKTHEAVVHALRAPYTRTRPPGEGQSSPEEPTLETASEIDRSSEEPDVDLRPAEPYQEASFRVPSRRDPHLVGMGVLAGVVRGIVEAEGPIHEEETGRRVAHLWGLQRAGSRIQAAVAAATRAAERSGQVVKTGSFLHAAGQPEKVRDRSDVQSRTLLKAEMLPPSEIREAVRQFVRAHVGCAPTEAIVGATRLFGFRRAGPDLKAVFEIQLRLMLRDDELSLRDGNVYEG